MSFRLHSLEEPCFDVGEGEEFRKRGEKKEGTISCSWCVTVSLRDCKALTLLKRGRGVKKRRRGKSKGVTEVF